MNVPLQITMRNVDHSAAVEDKVRQKANKLNQFFDHIVSCQVVIDAEQAHRQTSMVYNVRIHVTIPGKDLIANHNRCENLYLAIREAFDDMVRQVEENAKILQGDVKRHSPVLHGEIDRLFIDDGYGFIVGPNGDEYYFNSDSLVKKRFDHLKVGMPVHFIEKTGDYGMKACRVSVEHHRS